MLDHDQIVEKLLIVLKDNTSIEGDPPVLTEDSSLPTVLGLDSMDLVSLGMAIEDEFRIEIDSDELVGKEVTLGRIVALIQAQHGEATHAAVQAG